MNKKKNIGAIIFCLTLFIVFSIGVVMGLLLAFNAEKRFENYELYKCIWYDSIEYDTPQNSMAISVIEQSCAGKIYNLYPKQEPYIIFESKENYRDNITTKFNQNKSEELIYPVEPKYEEIPEPPEIEEIEKYG